MTVSPGSRLGPYEIFASLGAGGMGEVYRAQDTRLSREVAIKVLPQEVSADPTRLKRFEKEAWSHRRSIPPTSSRSTTSERPTPSPRLPWKGSRARRYGTSSWAARFRSRCFFRSPCSRTHSLTASGARRKIPTDKSLHSAFGSPGGDPPAPPFHWETKEEGWGGVFSSFSSRRSISSSG